MRDRESRGRRTPGHQAPPAGRALPARLAIAAGVMVGAARCGGAAGGLPADLQHLVDSAAAASPTPGIMLRVESPKLALDWSGAAGRLDRAAEAPLPADAAVRIASNTKTFVAAATLRLVEQGRVALDTSIRRYLSDESLAALGRGGYDSDRITVRHLLNHTSGIFDYAMSPQFGTAVFSAPDHRWTRPEQLAFAVDSGQKVGEPGERYHYSDTGYILLGELIERATGRSMAQAVRELLDYQRLGLRHTYFESLEPEPEGMPVRAHQYQGDVDATGFDPSLDLYGGGGLVSTLGDLTRFYRALLTGGVFERSETLSEMLLITPQSEADRPGGYGMGIGRSDIAGTTCWGHSGYWGTTARYCPDLDLAIAASVNMAGDTTGTLQRVGTAAIEYVAARSKR
ncbi:MAG: serine hydrolase domain-containing protein [Gemmatimonadales bacterium]